MDCALCGDRNSGGFPVPEAATRSILAVWTDSILVPLSLAWIRSAISGLDSPLDRGAVSALCRDLFDRFWPVHAGNLCAGHQSLGCVWLFGSDRPENQGRQDPVRTDP